MFPTGRSASEALTHIESLLHATAVNSCQAGPGKGTQNHEAKVHDLWTALQSQLQPSPASAAAVHAVAVALQAMSHCGGVVLSTVCQGLEVRALAEVGGAGSTANHAALSGGQGPYVWYRYDSALQCQACTYLHLTLLIRCNGLS